MGGIITEILEVNSNNFDKTMAFLKDVKALKEIDDSIVKKANIIVSEETVLGAISYEQYGLYGLIRYFIFKREVEIDTINELFRRLEERAIQDGIKYLFSIICDNDVRELFDSFDFYPLDKEHFFIEEEKLSKSKYEDAIVMAKKIQ